MSKSAQSNNLSDYLKENSFSDVDLIIDDEIIIQADESNISRVVHDEEEIVIIKLDENVVDLYSDFTIEEGDIDDTSDKDIQDNSEDQPEYDGINISSVDDTNFTKQLYYCKKCETSYKKSVA